MNALGLLLLLAAPFEEHHVLAVKPTGMNDRAVLKGPPPWCKEKLPIEAGWSEGRLYRSLQSSDWVAGAMQLCEFPDEPTWQKNAEALIQSMMNNNSSNQQAAEAFIKKAIANSLKEKANEGKEPSDEERLAFGADDFNVTEPEAGVEQVKPGKMAWCQGLTLSDRWDSRRINRSVGTQYGIDGVVDGAAHLCFRQDDPSWQKEGAYVLQKWMNWTHQSKADAEKSLAFRVHAEKLKSERDTLCKALEVPEEVSGGERMYGAMERRVLGCENNNQPLWQDTSGLSDDVAYYFDPNTNPPNEIVRMAHLIRSTEVPFGKDVSGKTADSNRGIMLYAAAQHDFAALDAVALNKMLGVAPYNDYARVVANETLSYLKASQKLWEAAVDKMTKSDADYRGILREAPKKGWEQWDKVTAQWKAEIARSNDFEAKLFGPSRKALKGCMSTLYPDVQKLIKSYKLTDYSDLRGRISGDPMAMLLMSRLALCAGYEKVYGLPGALQTLVKGGRDLRGPRSMAYYAMLDALAEAQKDRPKIPLSMPNWAIGGQSIEAFAKDFDMSGGIGYNVEASEPKGVVASAGKVAEGIEIKFKKSKYTYPEADCHDDKSHPLKIESNGTIRYYQLCKYTGKMITVDTTPRPIVVAAQVATGVKPGVYAVGQEYSGRAKNGSFMGIVHFTKATPKDKKIQTFYGFDL